MAMSEAFTVGIVLAAKDMYSGAMKKAQRNLGILRKTSEDSADAFEKSMKRFQGIAAAGAAVSVVSSQMSRKIEEMTTDVMAFSAAMGKTGTVVLDNLGKFKSHQEAMEAWRTKALNLSTRSLFNATELINDASYELMSSGLKADEAMDMLESVSSAAIATVGNLETTAGLFGSIMNTFGKRWDMSSAEKGARIMDVLAGAVKQFQWTGDVLAEGLSYATATAKTMNVRFEDTVAVLGMLNSQGVKGTKAGTSLNATFRELIKNAKGFGISIEDTNGNLLPLPEILEKINKKMKGMGAVEKARTILKYFGEEGGKAINLLLENSEGLKAYIELLQKTGIATKMVEQRMSTLAGQTAMIEHRWQNLRIEMGDRAVPVMMIAKKSVIDLVDVLGEIPEAKAAAGITLGVVGLIAEVGKAVGPALTMVGILGMWRTQAALAATAQAALNKQMVAGGTAASSQAMKMGIVGSKGTALVGVLGKVSAIGAAAFIGWGIGTALRQIKGFDEAVQNLLATLSGADLGEKMDDEFTKANEVINKLRNNLGVTKKELMWFVNFKMAAYQKSGFTYEQMKTGLMEHGVPEEAIEEVAATRRKDIKKSKSIFSILKVGSASHTTKPKIGGIYETGEKKPSGAVESAAGGGVGKESYYKKPIEEAKKPSPPKIEPYQIGIKRVDKTGLALIHEGEEIRPKSMAGRGAGIVNRNKELRDEAMRPFFPQIKSYQIGIKRVGKTGLALIHEGEEIKPKSMAVERVNKTVLDLIREGKETRPRSIAGGGTGTTIHMGGVTINLKSTGSAPMDARSIVDAVIREFNRRMKMEARRLP